ncbi:MAG TPA: GYD domain-containing protein [Candidatus Binatia bacterium]|nr:GYD domain-containing protein [Candidatus Binatia bacterium]
MAKYLFIGSYTAEGARGLLKDGGSGRRKVAEEVVRSLGGTVEAYYFAFGSDDFYLLADLPDHAAAAALSLTVGSSGAVSVRTVVLMTPEEVDAATQRSVPYRPPGA